jgi:short-subunit dehydrogenase
MKSLNGKITLITGAAGGIARETAALLLQHGVRLALTDVNAAGLRDAGKAAGADTLLHACDVTKRADVVRLVKAVRTKLGRIDILINTAGIIVPGPFAQARPADIDRQVQVNLMGALNMIREAAPVMMEAGEGCIITISSMAGIVPETNSAVYTATKYALRGLGLTLNLEMKPYNIHVGTVFPDSVDTPMLRYEATHGGSPLTFLNPPQHPRDVARAVLRAITGNRSEVYVPASTGVFSKIVTIWPGLVLKIWPLLAKMGAKNKAKILKQFGMG